MKLHLIEMVLRDAWINIMVIERPNIAVNIVNLSSQNIEVLDIHLPPASKRIEKMLSMRRACIRTFPGLSSIHINAQPPLAIVAAEFIISVSELADIVITSPMTTVGLLSNNIPTMPRQIVTYDCDAITDCVVKLTDTYHPINI